MDEDDLKKRTKKFALRILKLIDALPNTAAGRTVAGQLARSATSVAANYRAACRGKSKPDLSPNSVLLKKKKQMKANFGWS
jgi:four helix bundle protein